MHTGRSSTQLFFPPLEQVSNDEVNHISPQSSAISPSGDIVDNSSNLWNNIDTLSMPESSTPPPIPLWSTPKDALDTTSFPLATNSSRDVSPTTIITTSQRSSSTSGPPEDTSVFNISWGGGQDRPPLELHHEDPVLPTTPSKPLPKPRGIRRLPEPEPSEDGTLDEDTLKRRKNTSAARKSRMKKLMHIEHLEHQIQQLQSENSQLVLNNALVESEKKSLLAKEQEYKKRIKYLEDIVRLSCDHVLDNPKSFQ
ncbi:hypothetical protein BC941DRAFT_457909 [Chlamydoabsidia padenii]|nr:hypothetical protein BC941DRAFT_457909 [Chlamydoabsidia padenii]